MNKILNAGITWILIGVGIFLFSQIILDGNLSSLFNQLDGLFAQLGMAFISLGVVAIIIGLRNWKDYFQERLREIVIQRSYLETLSDYGISGTQYLF